MILHIITKANCVMVCFKFSHSFLFMRSFFFKFFFVPRNYTNILPMKDEKPNPTVCKIACKSFLVQKSAFSDETGWLKKLNVWSSSFDLQNHTAFSAFLSQLLLDESFKSISTLFPLLFESINSPATVFHCMKIIKRLVDFLTDLQTYRFQFSRWRSHRTL